MAAVFGERFSAEAVAAALEKDELEVVRQLETLRVSQGLLEEDGAGFRFAHSRYREALLQGMSQAMRRQWHTRLADRRIPLPPAERTYHLVHGGDTGQGIQALLEEGDRTRRQSNWRDALRYYMEALWLAQSQPHHDDRLHLTLFQRIGDLHLMCAGQHEIARSYYQAASSWAVTPRDRILFLCRLASTRHGGSPLRRQLLEEAETLLFQIDDHQLQDWVRFLGATCSPPLTTRNRDQLYSLVRRLHPIPDLPDEWFGWVVRFLFELIAQQGNRDELEYQTERVKTLWPEAGYHFIFHQALAGAYRMNSLDLDACRHHLRQARYLCARVGFLPGQLSSIMQELELEMQKGEYKNIRQMIAEFSAENPQPGPLWMIYQKACATWAYDRTPEGLEWAARYLEGVAAFFLEYPTDGGHLRSLLGQLGTVERIFGELGREEEFKQRIDALRDKLSTAGYRTDVSWYLSPPVDLPSLPSAGGLEGWRHSEKGEVLVEEDLHLIYKKASPDLPPVPDRPRLSHLVSGDFALQATIHPGSEVLEGMLRYRQEPEERESARMSGSGGLCAVRDEHRFLYLSAHEAEPGEVLFCIHEGRSRPLGRGLLHDRPLSLRLERTGTIFRAYAGDETGAWLQVGSVDLPGWSEVEVGMFSGPLPVQRSPVQMAFAHARFRDIRLKQTVPQPVSATISDPLYHLPQPAYFPGLPDTVAASRPMRDILDRVRSTASSLLPVLVQGETGTGKELIVRAVHALGDRSRGPFISLNCASLPPELLQNELFGHARGAFTGAYETRGGLFEAAHGGILFLDEIGEASPQFQVHLLRALEERVVRRIGDQRQRPVDVRFVAATNQDMQRAMDENRFRRDFFFRLKGVDIHLPPLRERREDIPHLIAHALRHSFQCRKTAPPGITQRAVEQLLDYDWPGNVRELLNAVTEAAERAGEEPISSDHLSIHAPPSRTSGAEKDPDERQRITAALRANRGNVSAAARHLGISRNTIYRRMRQLGIT